MSKDDEVQQTLMSCSYRSSSLLQWNILNLEGTNTIEPIAIRCYQRAARWQSSAWDAPSSLQMAGDTVQVPGILVLDAFDVYVTLCLQAYQANFQCHCICFLNLLYLFDALTLHDLLTLLKLTEVFQFFPGPWTSFVADLYECKSC